MVYPGSTAPALAGVALDIWPGQSLAIVGQSGSGKTTLLHLLAGILTPTSGSVTYNGKNGPVRVDQLSDDARAALRREQFGFVFQQGLLLDELTAVENVAVALMLNGMPRQAAETQAAGWLSHLGLAGLEDRRLGQLSGGQAQRVAIARAQITGAPLLFADEPTGSLDSHTGDEVVSVLLDAVAGGRTLVMVTHNLDLAARCDRVVSLRDGVIVSDTAAFAAGYQMSAGAQVPAPMMSAPVPFVPSVQAAMPFAPSVAVAQGSVAAVAPAAFRPLAGHPYPSANPGKMPSVPDSAGYANPQVAAPQRQLVGVAR